MKQTIITVIVVAIISFLAFNYFTPVKHFDTKPYEAKIDSLQTEIDSVENENIILNNEQLGLENTNQSLLAQTQGLKNKIQSLREDNSHVKIVDAFTHNQVDSFFKSRYANLYIQPAIDTTVLPLPVAKAAATDILELDKTKIVLANADSLINVQSQLINGKDQVITVLKTKETNYQSVISLQLKQQDNYKAQIIGLKDDVKKSSRLVKNQKIKSFILGAAVIGLAVTHK
jgi:hypothetical protein